MLEELICCYNYNKMKAKQELENGYLHTSKFHIDCMLEIKEVLEKQYNYYIRP